MATISVVMPVYNTAVPFLQESIDSILNQTFRDFEFIIIDDGSTNEAKEYLDGLTDSRIRLIRNKTNIGITKSLNIGLRAAQGKYVARMDSDDISFPERFEKQVAFMETHPDAIACGTKTVFARDQSPVPHSSSIEKMESYRVRMLFRNPGPYHPTAIFDREKLLQHHISYDEELLYAQDYGMWMTASRFGSIYMVPEVLLYYRKHPDQISKVHREQQIRCDKMTQKKLLVELLDQVTDDELDLHYVHSTGTFKEATINHEVNNWYDRLIKANKKKRLYDQKILKQKIDSIKKRLVFQTINDNTSWMKRALLLFRYLSFETVWHMLIGHTKAMIKRVIKYD